MSMKPILFNTDMVRAILEGRKTVTRRVVKPQPEGSHDIFGPSEENDGTFEFFCGGFDGEKFSDWITAVKMPYQPGDIMYVRETWAVNNITPHDPECVYKADYDCTKKPYERWKWRPSIHMPKEAARIFLRVTGVRVERLQEITDEQALAEGIQPQGLVDGKSLTPRFSFINLWDSTIKPAELALYGWTANPWVWVIEFARISKEEALK